MVYDAFISYSHAADVKLAPALQRALSKLAKPWYRRRYLNVFRDETDLSAASDLTGAICAALSSSRYFVYLASPNAANSRWVGEEIESWKKRNLPENLLIALTEGEIEWDIGRQSFNWEKSNALHPNLKGVFSREPLWVDLRWAKGDQNFSPRNPRFQHATAMLAAPMHGKTLDELVGEDVLQHRKTKVLIGAVIGTLALSLAVIFLYYLIATNAKKNLESKLTLIENIMPFFKLGKDDSGEAGDERPRFERLWSSIRANLLDPTKKETWIEWGADRLAVADDCFSNYRVIGEDGVTDIGHYGKKEEEASDFDCPKLKSEFDEDGLRTDIYGLNAMARTLVSSLNEGRIKELLKECRGAEPYQQTTVDDDLKDVFVFSGILLPDKLWKQVTRDTKGTKRGGEFPIGRYFRIWRKPLDVAGEGTELIFIQLIDIEYVGSGGSTTPTLGFLRVGEKYKIIFAQVLRGGEIAIYDTGRGRMPQFFTIGMTQGGSTDQYRIFSRYTFHGDCVCYRPYLTGSVESSSGSLSDDDQRVPQDLASNAVQKVLPSRDTTKKVQGSKQDIQRGLNPTDADPGGTNRGRASVESSNRAPSTVTSSAPTVSSLIRIEDIEGEYVLTSSTTSPLDNSWRFDKAHLVVRRLEPGYVLILQSCDWNQSPRESCWNWWVMQWRDGKLFAPEGRSSPLRTIRLSRQPKTIILISSSSNGVERLDVFSDAAGRVVSDPDLIRRMRAARSSWESAAKHEDYRQEAYSVPIELAPAGTLLK